MDVVYFVRPGDRNEELRYSLRTLCEHYPHERVVIAGYKPSWVTGVKYIHVPAVRGMLQKYPNVLRAIRAVCNHADITDSFVIMNDDFFFLRDMAHIPRLNRGSFAQFAQSYSRTGSRYGAGAVQTLAILRHISQYPLSYELHAPMVVDKSTYLEALDLPDRYSLRPVVPHHRSMYGNLVGYGGQCVADYKVYSSKAGIDWSRRFASTRDYVFNHGLAGQELRERYTEASPYEH